MATNRRSRREKVRKEKQLDLKNSFDIVDPTPLLAVKRINERGGWYGNAAESSKRTTC